MKNITHKHGQDRALPVIAATASGRGPSAVALIRISGTACLELCRPILGAHAKLEANPRVALLGSILDPETQTVIDQSMVTYFPGPRSFTGEDTIEVQCHGGPYIVDTILNALFQLGVEPAKAGEFTYRAFLNEKMDLTTAEGVRELVTAQSRQQWLAARNLADGSLQKKIDSLRDGIVAALAQLEARIDFPDEHETAHLPLAGVMQYADQVAAEIDRLLSSFRDGKVAVNGLRVALVGPPNAGKSSLLNALLDHERSIVTDIAGTTRDYIEEPCLLNGRMVKLVDTAGIRDASDHVEQLGIERSYAIARECDLVLVLYAADSTAEDRHSTEAFAETLDQSQRHAVLTKEDLSKPDWFVGELAVSDRTEGGLENLKTFLVNAVDEHVNRLADKNTFISSARHQSALEKAADSLRKFYTAADERRFDECLAFELQEACRHLQSIIGDVGSEDILDRVFSTFCVGK